MLGLHGFTLLWWPLPLLVTSLVFSGVFCSSSGTSSLCKIPCCFVQPTCDNAQHVTCDCPLMDDTIILRNGGLPETVQAITIINTRYVTIEKDAISGLHSLNKFNLNDIDELEIKQDGMALPKQSKLRFVTINNIKSFQIESKAFSVVWSLEPNGSPTSIFELNLHNITMNVCHNGSFGGNISHTELNNVTIVKANAKCFYGLHDFVTLKSISLKIKNVQPKAFSGKMRELIIEDSSFTIINERSFFIHVRRMELKNTFINELHSKGLSVMASDAIRLDTVQVEYLQRNAFAGLHMERNKERYHEPLFITKLKLNKTENGSLTFSECTQIELTDLDLAAHKPSICPTKKLTQTLSVGGEKNKLTQAQYQIYNILLIKHPCPEDSFFFNPDSGESPRCDQTEINACLDDGRDNTLHGDTQDVSSQESSAKDDVLCKYKDDDQSNSGDLPSVTGSAGTASSPGAASITPETVPTTTPDAMNFTDKNEDAKNGFLVRTNIPATIATTEDRNVSISDKCEKETGSPKYEEPLSTEAWDKFDNGYKDIKRTQVLTLGVILSLAVVLAVPLLVLLLRRHHSRQLANNQQSAQEMLAGALADRLFVCNEHEGRGDGSVQTGNTGGLLYSSASQSVSYHHYEPVRSELLRPPLPTRGDLLPPHQLTRGDLLMPLPVGPQPQRACANVV